MIDRIVLKVSEQYGLTTQESELLVRSIQNDLQPNIVFDQEATRIKQDAAAEAVQPVIYKKGQNIVMKGEVVTPSQYAVLDSLGMMDQPASTIDYSLAAILYIALLFAVYVIYVLNFEKKLAENVKHIAILSILTVLVMAVSGILAQIAPSILITTMAVILAAVLISTKNAVSYAVFISLLIVTVLTGKHAFFTENVFKTVIISTLGGVMAAVTLRKATFRAGPILAGVGGLYSGCIAGNCIMERKFTGSRIGFYRRWPGW